MSQTDMQRWLLNQKELPRQPRAQVLLPLPEGFCRHSPGGGQTTNPANAVGLENFCWSLTCHQEIQSLQLSQRHPLTTLYFHPAKQNCKPFLCNKIQSHFMVETGLQTRAFLPFLKATAAWFAVILKRFSCCNSISVIIDVLWTTKRLNLHTPLTEEISFGCMIKMQLPSKLYAASKYLKIKSQVYWNLWKISNI